MKQSAPTIAISADVLTCIGRLSPRAGNQVSNFIKKFRVDPQSPGLNYERIANASDSRFRSVRINRDLRGIVLKPDGGNIHLLLWVDSHDEAYEWAVRSKARVHPDTGALQVYPIESRIARTPSIEATPETPALFRNYSDRKLCRIGVPADLLPTVRSIRSEAELRNCKDTLPGDAMESLELLEAGCQYDEIVRELERSGTGKGFKSNDFAGSLKTGHSKRKYWVVDNEDELQRMLDSPLEKWRVFLHPTQRSLVERDWNGPVRVLGGPGTGKTVAAMHRARWLARNWLRHDNERILFTTYTTNLAADIESSLKSFCDSSTLQRIEVTNVDRWVYRFLRSCGETRRIKYFSGEESEEHWRNARLELPTGEFDRHFLQSEWQEVVQANGISRRREYLKVSRRGRGTPLNRVKRARLWRAFDAYRAILDEEGFIEPADAFNLAAELMEERRPRHPICRAVIVDEAQDMGMAAFRMLRKLAPQGDDGSDVNSMFIVGDAHQRIYGSKLVLGHCGVNIIGRGRKLRVNYRTSDEIRAWGTKLISSVEVDDLDGAADDVRGYRSLFHGPKPKVVCTADRAEEIDTLVAWINGLRSGPDKLPSNSICVIARTGKVLKEFRSELVRRGIDVWAIKRREADDSRRPGVRLATMHRAKGLEFMAVAIVALNRDNVPNPTLLGKAPDKVARDEIWDNERRLIFVAATRAKKELLVTSSGSPSKILADLR